MLPFSQIVAFVKVADCGSFTRAAIELDLSHSSLSRQVLELEGELGYAVFRRTGRGIRLTDAGKRLYEHSRHLLEVASRLEDEARGLRGVIAGTVAIGMPGSVAQRVAAPLASVLGERHPLVRIRVVEGLSGSIEELLASGRLDMGIFFSTAERLPADHTPLFLSDLYLVGPPGSLATRNKDVRLAALQGLPFVLPGPPHAIRSALDRALAAAGATIRVTHEIESMATMKRMVEEGLGHTVSTWSSVADEVEARRLSAARIVRPVLTRALVMAPGRDRPASGAAAVVAAHLRDVVSALMAGPRLRWRPPRA